MDRVCDISWWQSAEGSITIICCNVLVILLLCFASKVYCDLHGS